MKDIQTIDHATLVYANALRRKKSTPSPFVQQLLENKEVVIDAIQIMLTDNTFEPHEPHQFKTVDGLSGKIRDVQAPEIWPDQFIHWALIMRLEPIFMRGMYSGCCGSVPGRGPAAVRKYIHKKFKDPHVKRKYKYCLKLDIHHFFQSVDQEILIGMLRRKIKDEEFLELCAAIIRSVKGGLPIGYYTSQWFANFYLEAFDHYVKEVLKVDFYVRYVDDIVICDSKKRRLHKLRREMAYYLEANLGLHFKGNWQVFSVQSRGIDFVGYRFYHNRTGIRRRILRNIVKANRRCRGAATRHALISMLSYYGYLDHSDTFIFAKKHLTGSKKYFVKRLKELDKYEVDSERDLVKKKAYERRNKPQWLKNEEARQAQLAQSSEAIKQVA